jgi:hypothetical protein
MTAPLDAGRATETETFSALMDKLCMAYLRRGEGELPGGARLRVEAYVTALRARVDASERVREAGVRVEKAITNEGRVPGYHRGVMHRHRVEWPTLWAELDALRTSLARVS